MERYLLYTYSCQWQLHITDVCYNMFLEATLHKTTNNNLSVQLRWTCSCTTVIHYNWLQILFYQTNTQKSCLCFWILKDLCCLMTKSLSLRLQHVMHIQTNQTRLCNRVLFIPLLAHPKPTTSTSEALTDCIQWFSY